MWKKTFSYLYYIGMFAVVVGFLLRLTGSEAAFYIFAAGVVPVVGVRLYNYAVTTKERKRINLILVVSSMFLAFAAYAMFVGKGYWILGILISAVLDFYISFRKV